MQNTGKLDESMEHYLIARDVMIAAEDLYGGGSVCQNIGILHAIDSNYVEAIQYFEEALGMFEQIEFLSGMARLYDNIGLCYSKLGDIPKAIEYNDKGLELHTQNQDPYGIGMALLSKSDIYFSAEMYAQSVRTLRKAEQVVQGSPYTELKKDIYKGLYQSYEKMNDFKNSFYSFKQFNAYKDSTIEIQNERMLEEIEGKYQNEKNKKEIELLNKDAELSELKISEQDATIERDRYQKFGLWIGLGLVLIIAVISVVSFINKRKANEIITEQKRQVEEKHEEITDSISYAEKIQLALLGNQFEWNQIGKERFILFMPKDQVSGDFYWCRVSAKSNKYAWVAADCTGHGVPGAMMSMLGMGLLNETFNEIDKANPAEILDILRAKIIKSLETSTEDNQRSDGMDMALCSFDPDTRILSFAGAHNPLWIVSKRPELEMETKPVMGDNGLYLHEIRGSRVPVGRFLDQLKPYQSHDIKLDEGDMIYTFSDGYADQFGGENGKKFKYANFKKLLLSINQSTADDQKAALNKAFHEWRGPFEQIDDVVVIGVRV